MKENKKEKVKYIEDDGRTIYDMSGLSKPRISLKKDKKSKISDSLMISRKERRAMIRAAFETYLPVIIIFIVGFAIAALLLYFWLK